VRRVKDAYNRLATADDSTLIDFDERDLIRFAERAGFRKVELTYEASV